MENMLLLIPVNDIFAASSVTMLWLILLSLSSLLLSFYLYQLGIGEGRWKERKREQTHSDIPEQFVHSWIICEAKVLLLFQIVQWSPRYVYVWGLKWYMFLLNLPSQKLRDAHALHSGWIFIETSNCFTNKVERLNCIYMICLLTNF